MLKVKFEIVRSSLTSWNSLFEQAAEIATAIGPDRLINISQSADNGDGVVTIWYWDGKEEGILGSED